MRLGKTWIVLGSTVVLAAAAFAVWPFLPKRYQSQTTIIVVPSRVPAAVVAPVGSTSLDDLEFLRHQILSRPRLERVIIDLRLYEPERQRLPMEDVVERMREDVGFTVASPYGRTDAGGVGFTVSFVSPSPTTSRDVTDRLSSLVVNESLQHREVLGEATRDFLAGQAEAVRGRLIEHGKKVELSRTGKNVPETQVLMIEEAALRDTYKSLLAKLSEVDLNATLERRQIGEQFKVLDRARVPKRPLGPTRAAVTFVGAVIGLCVGLVLAAVSASRRAGQVRPVTP